MAEKGTMMADVATGGRRSGGNGRRPSVYVRLDPPIAVALANAAEAAGLSAAGWTRARIIEALPGNYEIRPSPSIRARIPDEDIVALSQLSADLSRVGGALVQMTKALRLGEHISHHAAEAVLTDLRTVQRAIQHTIASLDL